MADYRFYTGNSDSPVVLTEQEIADIIAKNEVEDVIGVEEDIKVLIKTKYTGSVPIQVHVSSVVPFNMRIAITSDPNFWS